MNSTYFILVWDHKHGMDLWLYSTYDNAKMAGIALMRETAEEWGEDVSALPDDVLWREWTDISGDTEFFSIEERCVEC